MKNVNYHLLNAVRETRFVEDMVDRWKLNNFLVVELNNTVWYRVCMADAGSNLNYNLL